MSKPLINSQGAKLLEGFNGVMKTAIVFLALLSGCIPAGQNELQTQTQVAQTSQQVMFPDTKEFLTTALSISSLQASFAAHEAFLKGEEIPINNGYAKGKLRLLSSMILPIPESLYLVLPVEGNLVLGSGVYLLLLEKQGSTYVQIHDVYLGLGAYLFSLEYKNNRMTSVTVDPRTGKPPFNTPRGGTQVFEIKDGQLLEN